MLVEPSPKFHAQEVILPTEVSVKATANGTVPDPGFRVKFATGVEIGNVLLT